MSKLYSNFILNNDKKVLFAYVPKVACSNWKGIMRSLTGAKNYLNTAMAHDRNLSGLEYLSNADDPQGILNSSDFKKYAFVRNPYSRILSAYLNKVEARIGQDFKDNDHFFHVLQDINTYRKEHFDLALYPEVNFFIFLMWMKDSGSMYTYDEHWKPQSQLLDIKKVKFDRIGKFENLADEANDFIKLLGADVEFPTQKEIKFKPTGAINKIEKYYDESCYELVNSIYEDDFAFFDYQLHLDIKEPKITFFERLGIKAKIIEFDVGEYIVNAPIELDSFDKIQGKGKDQTILKVVGSFSGPFIKTKRLEDNLAAANWFYEDGVPIRFHIKNLTIDLSSWKPKNSISDIPFAYGDLSSACIGIYGKAYELENLLIMNVAGSGLISICSSKGGKKDFYLDAPEAKIGGLEVINTKEDGVVFAGPHDSILKDLIISHSKKKGIYIVSDDRYSGACDIDFIHAYATDDIAIDIQSKVKARFLQGDTGRSAGVVLGGSNKTIVDTIEVFKTRAKGGDDYSVKLECSEAQIATVRIRADAGANGLNIAGFGNTITSLHIDSRGLHSDFKHLESAHLNSPICVSGNQNNIIDCRMYSNASEIIKTPAEKVVKRFNANITVINTIDKATYKASSFQLSNIQIKRF